MSPFPDYLLKLSVSFALIALFYHFALRKLTFFQWNRWYLILYTALCFAVPFVDIGNRVREYPQDTPAHAIVHSIPIISLAVPPPAHRADLTPETQTTNAWDTRDWLVIAWIAGMLVMTCRLVLHIVSLNRIRSKSTLFSNDGIRFYHFDDEIPPFSFGKSIFYNPHLHEPDELQDMILHEYIHVRQRHTFDVIWSELLCIVNWYNPFVWMISQAIRQNLEYIADNKVVENHADTKNYQYLLLKTAVGPAFRLANHFGFISLKQRIVMMNKAGSPRILLSCFLFIIPLLAVLLVAFRQDLPNEEVLMKGRIMWVGPKNDSKRAPKEILHLSGLLLDAKTGKPVANLPLRLSHDEKFIKTIRTDADGFYFAEVTAKAEPKVMHSYYLTYDGGEFAPFVGGKTYQADYAFGDGFDIWFLPQKVMAGHRLSAYSVPSSPFYDSYHPENVKTELKAYLSNNLPPFLAENRLRVEFRENNPWPKGVITLYKTGYFDRKKELMGYEGKTKLYLNGKKATYQQINEAFRSYPYMLSNAQEHRVWYQNGISSEIAYITFPIHRDAPPVALIKGNIEIIDTRKFDIAALVKEPYLLDGFRQVYGASSNLMPLPQEIKKVVLLKGKLARYYDPALDRIWWIETRPVAEVFERPDFAAK